MKVKALVSFSGTFSMTQGEIKECSNKATLKSLLKVKYVEKVEEIPEIPPKKNEKVENEDGDLINES